MGIGSYLKNFDYFGHNVSLHYGLWKEEKEGKAENEFKTMPGATCSILLRITMAYFVYYFFA